MGCRSAPHPTGWNSSKEIERCEATYPGLETDEQAEHFVATADLSEYDLSDFRPVQFKFQPKAAQLNMRLPRTLLEAVKESGKARGIPYTRFVRETLEQAVAGLGSPPRR